MEALTGADDDKDGCCFVFYAYKQTIMSFRNSLSVFSSQRKGHIRLFLHLLVLNSMLYAITMSEFSGMFT